MTDGFPVRVTILLQRLVSLELADYLSVFNLFLTQQIMAISSKRCKIDNSESHNSLNLALRIFEPFVRILLNVNSFLN